MTSALSSVSWCTAFNFPSLPDFSEIIQSIINLIQEIISSFKREFCHAGTAKKLEGRVVVIAPRPESPRAGSPSIDSVDAFDSSDSESSGSSPREAVASLLVAAPEMSPPREGPISNLATNLAGGLDAGRAAEASVDRPEEQVIVVGERAKPSLWKRIRESFKKGICQATRAIPVKAEESAEKAEESVAEYRKRVMDFWSAQRDPEMLQPRLPPHVVLSEAEMRRLLVEKEADLQRDYDVTELRVGREPTFIFPSDIAGAIEKLENLDRPVPRIVDMETLKKVENRLIEEQKTIEEVELAHRQNKEKLEAIEMEMSMLEEMLNGCATDLGMPQLGNK